MASRSQAQDDHSSLNKTQTLAAFAADLTYDRIPAEANFCMVFMSLNVAKTTSTSPS